MSKSPFPKRPDHQRVVLILQGGGALGAYQAGVFQGLHEHGFDPDWIGGTSIGAINGALIAGNAREDPVAALDAFWDTVSDQDIRGLDLLPCYGRQFISAWSVWHSMLAGRPGFFQPRWVPATLGCSVGANNYSPLLGDPTRVSFYDTTPLRELLSALIDFERINASPIRLSLGAVNVGSGRMRYFDTRHESLTVDHVLASGALPPAFPAVRIDGELYWDGGIYSNTPLEIVLEDYPRHDTLCFAVALFNPAGPEPHSIPEAETRRKDILYGTRALQHVEAHQRTHSLRHAIQTLYEQLPEALRNDPTNRSLAELGCRTTLDIVRLTYPAAEWELANKDADFSRISIRERWDRGREDALRALTAKPWLEPAPDHIGVQVHEFSR